MKCPRCGKEAKRLLALSRADNKTMICDECGTKEALDDAGLTRGKFGKKVHTCVCWKRLYTTGENQSKGAGYRK